MACYGHLLVKPVRMKYTCIHSAYHWPSALPLYNGHRRKYDQKLLQCMNAGRFPSFLRNGHSWPKYEIVVCQWGRMEILRSNFPFDTLWTRNLIKRPEKFVFRCFRSSFFRLVCCFIANSFIASDKCSFLTLKRERESVWEGKNPNIDKIKTMPALIAILLFSFFPGRTTADTRASVKTTK